MTGEPLNHEEVLQAGPRLRGPDGRACWRRSSTGSKPAAEHPPPGAGHAARHAPDGPGGQRPPSQLAHGDQRPAPAMGRAGRPRGASRRRRTQRSGTPPRHSEAHHRAQQELIARPGLAGRGPGPETRDELGSSSTPRTSPSWPPGSPAPAVRHRRAARRAGRGPDADEPRRGHPGRGRSRRLPQGAGRRPAGSSSSATTPATSRPTSPATPRP